MLIAAIVIEYLCSKVTAPSVQPFLSSLGILVGEETHIVDKEVNEVAILRRVSIGDGMHEKLHIEFLLTIPVRTHLSV